MKDLIFSNLPVTITSFCYGFTWCWCQTPKPLDTPLSTSLRSAITGGMYTIGGEIVASFFPDLLKPVLSLILIAATASEIHSKM